MIKQNLYKIKINGYYIVKKIIYEQYNNINIYVNII